MNLKLYGICFKMRGGPDLLDYIQDNKPVPVDMMEQVMTQMGFITQDELAFAEKLDNDWKKAFNERVPLLMGVAADGGYDITCSVPDELLATVGVLTGMKDEKIVEEYTQSYLKNVCGVDASIISVDMEKGDDIEVKAEKQQGFDLNDLGAVPEEPAFEDISEFGDIDVEIDSPAPAVEEPIPEEAEYSGEMPADEEEPGFEEDYSGEEGFPEPEDEAYEEESYGEEPEPEQAADAGNANMEVSEAVKNIYTEFVGNIKDRKLDERLGLKIGS